jgi:GT2 family glycosyltransferase
MSAEPSGGDFPAAVTDAAFGRGGGRDVSIVIPTRGRPDALRRCLTSLVQWREMADIVVVDDDPGGTAAKVCEGFPCVRRIHAGGLGAAAARNHGAEAVATPWIAFLDDDCVPCHGWLEGLRSACGSDTGVLAAGNLLNGLTQNPYASATHALLDYLHEVDNGDEEDTRFVASANLMVSRDAFLEMGGFDPAYRGAVAEDRDFCVRWRQSGRRIRRCRALAVDHFHDMGLLGFCGQHFRYGVGAARFHHPSRRDRGMGGDRGYGGIAWYLRLLLHPFQGHPCFWAARLAAFLAVAQFMTVSGVAVGCLRWRRA